MSQKTPKSGMPAKAPAAKPAVAPKPVVVAKAAAPAEAPKPVAVKAPVVETPKPVMAPAAQLKPELLKVEAPKAEAKPIVTDKPVQPAMKAEAPAPVAQKGPETMTDTVRTNTNEAADRAQAMFGDINARAKDAMEKGAKLFQEMNDLNKGNLEAVVESSRRAAKGVETIAQNAAEYARTSFERQSAAMRSFAAVKSPTEFFQLQNDFVRGAFDSMVAETSKNSEAALKLAGDVFQPISNRFAVAAEKLKSAA